MGALRTYADLVDALNDRLGKALSWLMLPVVLIAFTVVLLRYGFSTGFPWLQELYIWLHGLAFMSAVGWVLKDGGHVRVDLVYRRLSPKRRAWLDLVGVFVFLMPTAGLMVWMSWPVVTRSWRLLEKSPTADGLPFVFVLKTFIPVFGVLLVLQGLAFAVRALQVLKGERAELKQGHGDE